MTTQETQEMCEKVTIECLRGGLLAAADFRHDDSGADVKSDMVIVKAGPPQRQLDGPRAYRVEVEVTLKSKTATANAALHGEAMARLGSRSSWYNGAIAAGMKDEDDLEILEEEFSGDREETKNLRKRSIVVPMLFRVNPVNNILTFMGENLTFENQLLTYSAA